LVLAQLILEELEAELGLAGRLQPLTIAPLRETRMPAVQVEPLTGIGAQEQKMLTDPDLPSRVARAVAAGVGRFFSG
jgi:N-acetylmuramoyl-L-alanine amidase